MLKGPGRLCGIGMAIEDGYCLAASLDGLDLRDSRAVNAGFEVYEKQRVDSVTHNTEFARFVGRMFHGLLYLWPGSSIPSPTTRRSSDGSWPDGT